MCFPNSNNTFEVLGATIINPGITISRAMKEGIIMNGFSCEIPKMKVEIKANNMNSIKYPLGTLIVFY